MDRFLSPAEYLRGLFIIRKKAIMVDYQIREDGRVEWVCPHGVGHTVSHIDPAKLEVSWIWIHGCDGCCPLKDKRS